MPESEKFPEAIGAKDALIVVDVQRDFLPGGSLAVPGGDEVVPVLNRYIRRFEGAAPIVATRDWHPADHCSFAARGGPWPPHCVQGTPGAEFAPDLALPEDALIVSKAMGSERDAYSGFDGTGLESLLKRQGTERVFVGGLATDYCVLETVKDARKAGFEVLLLADAIRAVGVEPGDEEAALAEMRDAGARPVRSTAGGGHE